MKRAIIALLIIAAIGAGAGAYYMKRNSTEMAVNTAPVTRGDIIDTVGATGTLQAVTTVQVGSQVSGNIQWLGADFNSIVRKGQVIARLDPSLFEAQLQQAKASLAQTQANLTKAQSDLERAKVQLADAQQKYTRAKELATRSLLPQSDLDSAQVAVDTAQASLASQEATVKQAQAAVAQSQANVNQSQVNLDHTIILAPIDGIVTQRSVDVGQTVAASLQSPTLFIIAADLTKMQVNANIDEADVGRIRPGQHVSFRVDAYPTEPFEGTVAQIRLQPIVVQNVTTYGTVIDVPNQQLKLKPGMTANVKVEVAKRTDVVRVPNTALRFRPTAEVFAALNQAVPPEAQFGGGGRGGRGGQGGGQGRFGPDGGAGGQQTAAPAASAQQGVTPGGNRSSFGGPATLREPQGRPEQGRGMPDSERGAGRRSFDGRGGRGGGGADEGDRRARMLERFKSMSPDEQKQFIARMKERGTDVSAFEQAGKTQAAAQTPASALFRPKYGEAQSAQTIDALFAPLPSVETRGRVWVFINRQINPVNLRLGVSDGTNTEVLDDELQVNTEVVTGVTGVGNVRPTLGGGGNANPFNPQRGFGGRGR